VFQANQKATEKEIEREHYSAAMQVEDSECKVTVGEGNSCCAGERQEEAQDIAWQVIYGAVFRGRGCNAIEEACHQTQKENRP
jgi:hypothetical protein